MPGHVRHVRLRHHGVRLPAHRARPHADRCSIIVDALPAPSRLPGEVRPQHHGHRRQDHQARATRAARRSMRSPSASSRRCMRTARSSACCSPDVEPRATQYMPQIIAMIQQLDRRGYAYVAADGDVMYCGREVRRLRQALGQAAWRICAPARASKSMRPSAIRSISCCGRRRSRASRAGSRPGAPGGRAGTSSARRCRRRCSATHFDIHGGGHGPQVPASRERDRADAARRPGERS